MINGTQLITALGSEGITLYAHVSNKPWTGAK